MVFAFYFLLPAPCFLLLISCFPLHPAPSQKIGRELGTHKKIVPGLGAHKRSHPDLKLLTKLEMSSPDLSEVGVQHLTMLETSSPDLSAVRVQRLTSAASVSASLNEVRVHMSKITKVSHPRGVCSTLNLWRVTAFTSTISWCRPGSICSPRQIVFTK